MTCKYYQSCGTKKDNCTDGCILKPLYSMRAELENNLKHVKIIKISKVKESTNHEIPYDECWGDPRISSTGWGDDRI